MKKECSFLRWSFCLSVLCAFLAGCETMSGVNVGTGLSLPGGVSIGANKTISGSGESARSRADKKQQAKLRLYVFDCGSLYFDDISAFGLSQQDTAVRNLFVPCYLVEHANGRLLWDAGLSTRIVGQGKQDMGNGVYQDYHKSLLTQLATLKLRPSDIDFVAFSHMHYDHVGGANYFAGATLLIQETEYEAAFKAYANYPIFDYTLYQDLAASTKVLLSGDYDVFGDGSVIIISTPGHTPGHQALFIDLEAYGPLVLSGDLYHFEASRRLRAVPEFNTNAAQTLASMDRLERMVTANQATLWIQHNRALAKTLRLAPGFYD